MEQPESALLSITKHNGVKSFLKAEYILFLILMFYKFSSKIHERFIKGGDENGRDILNHENKNLPSKIILPHCAF